MIRETDRLVEVRFAPVKWIDRLQHADARRFVRQLAVEHHQSLAHRRALDRGCRLASAVGLAEDAQEVVRSGPATPCCIELRVNFGLSSMVVTTSLMMYLAALAFLLHHHLVGLDLLVDDRAHGAEFQAFAAFLRDVLEIDLDAGVRGQQPDIGCGFMAVIVPCAFGFRIVELVLVGDYFADEPS